MRTAIDVTLDGDPSRAELHAMIADVSSAVDASRRTLDGLLALARSQAGSIRREPTDLATIAAGVIDAVDHAGITIDLQPAPVSGEASLLQRMANNLIDNAIRYNHPNGLVEVRTWVDDHTANLHVTNTGPVVPPGDLARLFQPFVRGSGPRVRARGGAGARTVYCGRYCHRPRRRDHRGGAGQRRARHHGQPATARGGSPA